MTKEHADLLERITRDPDVMVGKAVIRGTRVPVERVLQHLADNPEIKDVFEAFPHLKLEDIQACFAYARQAVERQRGRARKAVPAAHAARV